METQELKLYNKVYYLSIFTIIYNIVEGIVSVSFGVDDETLALFGFGLDSFIEAISGLGIAHMVIRIKRHPLSNKDEFEIRALKITGWCFYLLSVGLILGAILNIVYAHKPEATISGIIISGLSILVMWWLLNEKLTIGKKLNSSPIIADANCTRVCIYMSVVLLVASLIYELTGFAYADGIGTIGIIYFAIKEGKESLDKAKGKATCCDDHCN